MVMIDPATETALNKIIQPTDRIRACLTVNEANFDAHGQLNPASKGSRRYLGLIVNSRSGIEEALLVLFHRPITPTLTGLVPIFSDFQLSLTQTGGASTLNVTPATKDRFIITFSSPTPTPPSTITLIEQDVSFLSDLINEIKRIQKIAIDESFDSNRSHSHDWIQYYVLPSSNTIPAFDSQTLAKFDSLASAYSKRGRNASLISSNIEGNAIGGAATWGNDDQAEAVREELVREQRGRWVLEQLKEREGEFTSKEKIKIFCTTYNVNDKLPRSTDDLTPWLGDLENAELLVVGFQEFDLSTEALWRYTPAREDAWRTELFKGLGSQQAMNYVKIHSRQLVGALIIVFARKDCAQYISKVSSTHLATGIMGLVANKGAVSIRFRYKDTWITFVNSHLAAFANQTLARNQMVKDSEKYLVFVEEDRLRDPWTPNLRPEIERTVGTTTIFDSHHLIWMGDLNYRIDLPRADVLRMIEAKEWDMLLRFDQLKIQQKHKLAFADFSEASITFPPTFKFDVGTSNYDTSEKQRTPSWTDRIVYLSVKDDGVKCLGYRSCGEVNLSDHKPVIAVLEAEISTVVKEKRLRVQHEVMTELDQYDNNALPDVKLIPGPSIEFERAIRYLKSQTRTVEIVNVGSVVAQWFFTLKPGATTIAPPWLHISPSSGLLLPGEKSTISFTIRVDALTAPELNFAARDELNDLLILSIEKKDLFLSVAAREYFPTCFACPLERLARFSEGIRTYSASQLKAIAAHDGQPFPEDRAKIPRPAGRMLDFLAEHALSVDEIFLVPGDPLLVDEIRECLDEGDAFPLDQLFPMAETVISGTASMNNDALHSDVSVAVLEEIEEGNEDDDNEDNRSSPEPTFTVSPFSETAPTTPRVPSPIEEIGPDELVDEPVESEGDIGALSLSPTLPRHIPLPPSVPSPVILTQKHDPRRASVAPLSQTLRAKASDLGVLSMGDCFLRWCEALPDPIVPFGLYLDAIQTETREDAYALVKRMPMIHSSTLLYIIAFLRVLVQQSTEESERDNRLDRLAVVFSTVLLRPDPQHLSLSIANIPVEQIPRRRKQFVLSLLQGEQVEPLMGAKKAGFDDVKL